MPKVEDFFDLENDPKLSDITWMGVPAWDFFRHRLMTSNASVRIKAGRKRGFSKYFTLVRKGLISIWKIIFARQLFLGVGDHRYEMDAGFQLIDKWCAPLANILPGRSVIVLRSQSGRLDGVESENVVAGIDIFTLILRWFSPRRRSELVINQLNDCLINYSMLPIGIGSGVEVLCRHWTQFWIYRLVLGISRARIVFVVCSYGREGQVLACKSLKIPIIELQHGSINSNHSGYSFPHLYKKEAFPDYFFLYGPDWRSGISFPIAENRILSIGSAYWAGFPSRQRNMGSRDRLRVLVVSQWTCTRDVINFAIDAAQILPKEIQIFIRPHPSESLGSEDAELLGLNGIAIENPRDVSLSASFFHADIVFGAGSTVLYEALNYGLPVYTISSALAGAAVLDFPLVETSNDVFRVVERISHGSHACSEGRNLFVKFDEIFFLNLVDNISLQNWKF